MRMIMRNIIFTIVFILAGLSCHAQDLNPQHYSGKYHVTLARTLFAGRYISRQEHATFLSDGRPLAATKIRPCVVDFKKGMLFINDNTYIIKITSVEAEEYYLDTNLWIDDDPSVAYRIVICLDVQNASADSPVKMEFIYDTASETVNFFIIEGEDPAFIDEYFLVKEIK